MWIEVDGRSFVLRIGRRATWPAEGVRQKISGAVEVEFEEASRGWASLGQLLSRALNDELQNFSKSLQPKN